eukprot:8436-Heterococcus_DN1.PRE.2
MSAGWNNVDAILAERSAADSKPKGKKGKSSKHAETGTNAAEHSASPWYTQNEACMKEVFICVGGGHYLVLATVCKAWRAACRAVKHHDTLCCTSYQLLLHNDKFLKALWHPGMASDSWMQSDDGRQFRTVAGAIPIYYYPRTYPPAVHIRQLASKQARLQWLFENGMQRDSYVTSGACIAGDIEALKWLVGEMQCELDERCVEAACKHADMYILNYLKKQHCYYTAKALACAAEHCTRDQLYEIWCFGIKGDSSAIAYAAKRKLFHHLAITTPIVTACYRITNIRDNISYSSVVAFMIKVKLLRSVGIVWDAQTPAFAAAAGHLHIVQYSQCKYSEYPGQIVALANKCPWNKTTCEEAAVNGYLDILVWAHENGCKWDNKTFTKAAEGGHKHISEYLLAEQCLWSYDAREAASREGHTELLQWLIEHGCPDLKRCPDATRKSTRTAKATDGLCKWYHSTTALYVKLLLQQQRQQQCGCAGAAPYCLQQCAASRMSLRY